MSEGMLAPGKTLGSYEILEELGRGALGVVYRSRHLHLGRPVALKVLHPLWTASREFTERFREEGRVLGLLEHPNILRVYDAGEADGVFYLATQFLEGETLEELLRSPLSHVTAVHIAQQLAGALAYAHARGVVHRDVKPANVMVGPRGEATLMDFGVARLRDSPSFTMPGVQVGTPFYMAPEQILGRKADARSDLYSLGVVLHQMLAGQPPFPGPDTETVFHGHLHELPPPLDERCPAWLRRVVTKALAKAPDERFATAESFLCALQSNGDPERLLAAGVSEEPVRSPSPAGAAPAGGAATRFHRLTRTALSLDVVGSRRMKRPGTTLAVQQQFALFRDYVREKLESHRALDAAWSGDGLVALFAAPEDGVRAAQEILAGLGHFNAAFGGEPMRVRIGLHSGEILMGPGQPLGEVTSAVLDQAAHLQQISPEDSILVSEQVLARTDPVGWTPAGAECDSAFGSRVYRYSAAPERPAAETPRARPADGPLPPEGGAAPQVMRIEVALGSVRREREVSDEALIGRPDPATSRVPEIDLRGDDAVSRRHGRFFRRPDGFYLEDLESANGTMWNGEWLEARSPVRLSPGDRVELGESTVIRILSID